MTDGGTIPGCSPSDDEAGVHVSPPQFVVPAEPRDVVSSGPVYHCFICGHHIARNSWREIKAAAAEHRAQCR
jgi:hypothetical protein